MGIFTNKPKKNKYKPPEKDDLFYDYFESDEEFESSDNSENASPKIALRDDKVAHVRAAHAITAEEIKKSRIGTANDAPAEPETSLFQRVIEKATQTPAADSTNPEPIPDNHNAANSETTKNVAPDIFTAIAHSSEETSTEIDDIAMEASLFAAPPEKNSAEADSVITSLLEKCSSYIDDITEPESVEDIEISIPKVEPASGNVDDIILAAEQKATNRIKATYGDINLSKEANEIADEAVSQNEKKTISVDYAVLTPDESEPIITTNEPTATAETIVMEPVRANAALENEPIDATKVIDLGGTINADVEPKSSEPAIDGTTAFVMPNKSGTKPPSSENVANTFEDIFSSSDGEVHSISQTEIIYEKEPTLEDLYSQYDDEGEEDFTGDFTPPIKEYESLSDAAEIKNALLKRKKASGIRATVTAVIAVLSIIISIPSVCLALGLDGSALTVLHSVLLAIAVATNFKTVISIFSVLNGITKFDYVVALGAFAVVVHSVANAFLGGNQVFLTSAAASALTFNELGNYFKTSSIFNGFSQIASSDKKKAVMMFDNNSTAKSITGDNIEGDVLLATSCKTIAVESFIKNSYSPTPFDKGASKIMLISVIVAIVSAIATFSLTGNTQYALTVLPFALCLAGGAPLAFSAGSFLNILSKTASKRCGGMVAGFKAIEQLSSCNAVALDATDIFPRGTVISNDMRVISMNQIDETLTNAVALAIKGRSPISGMLKNLLENDIKELPEVDSYKYENRMGISGWVNDSFVLIGNRDLMTAHNIKLPSVSVDNKILKAGYFPIYIASNEKACALLIVSYHVNEHVAFDLRNACKLGLTVFVKSTDPNITSQMISDYFGVYDDFVCVLNRRSAKALDESTAPQQKCPALASFRGSSHSLLKMINAACSLSGCLKFLTVVAAVLAAAGIIAAVYSSASPIFPIIAAVIVPVTHIIYWAINAAVSALNKKIH